MSTNYDQIMALKNELGNDLCVMGHHYQSDAVMQYVDKAGDSLELARMMDNISAKHIVFCGVNFMAETATLLAKEGQSVHIPNPNADCDMALMVPAKALDKVLTKLNSENRKVIPIAYVNTPLDVKAIVGKFGGAVCTSANAKTMLKWAFDEAEKHGENAAVLFLPDANLAQNTAKLIGLSAEKILKLNLSQEGEIYEFESTKSAKLLLWPGYCPVHEILTLDQIKQARKDYPDCKIVLHPECPPLLVDNADYAGSTSYIIKLAAETPENSTLFVGTEVNLVDRLAKQYPNKNIFNLKRIACKDMAKITEKNLCQKLEEIKANNAKAFEIDDNLRENALLSITRMLNACS